jgi:hypothetical protein
LRTLALTTAHDTYRKKFPNKAVVVEQALAGRERRG